MITSPPGGAKLPEKGGKMKPVITFTDYLDRPTKLSAAELAWFQSVVDRARSAVGVDVEIIPFDHDLYRGKSKNALGCCCTRNAEDPLAADADSYITIDCFFIDEKYKERFEGGWDLSFSSLEEVIAHEIAHLYVWRHGKKHTDLTKRILEKINAA